MSMIRRSKKKRMQDNVLMIGIALVLSFFVYQIAEYSGVLTADITGGPAPEFNELSDIVVHQSQDGLLQIYAGKEIQHIRSVSLLLMYDPDVVQITPDMFRSTHEVQYAAAGTGKAMVVVTLAEDTIHVQDEIVALLVTGDTYAIVVADVVAVFDDGTQQSLSVQLPK